MTEKIEDYCLNRAMNEAIIFKGFERLQKQFINSFIVSLLKS
jgi:hypothetical protein